MNSESWILEERNVAEAELLAVLQKGSALLEPRQESVVMAGLESIVAMMALKAVTGVASGFTGKLLYGKWRDCTTRRKLNDLANQIPLVPIMADKVSEEVIRRDVVEVLMLEGLSLAQAEHLTERILARIKSRSAEGTSSEA